MLSKSRITSIKRIHQKKYRSELAQFVVEGIKSAEEFIHSDFICLEFYHTDAYQIPQALIAKLQYNRVDVIQISEKEMAMISLLSTPSPCFLIVAQPKQVDIQVAKEESNTQWILALDAVADPGNLGTIIRICDWFNVQTLVLGKGCVEPYNPKVIQSSMGSFTRVKLIETELSLFFEGYKGNVMGGVLGAENLYETNLPKNGVLVLGNEANGISSQVAQYLTHQIEIPRFGQAESLNVAVSSAIFLNQYRFQMK
jgi:RNA methyltransferase, TrmH family